MICYFCRKSKFSPYSITEEDVKICFSEILKVNVFFKTLL